MSIRFIHTADLHLDRPFHNMASLPEALYEKISQAPFQTLHTIISTAIEREVDFIILSGDLFDGSNPSLRAKHRFYKEVQRLEAYDIPVFLIHGNHDPLDSMHHENWPDHVFRFPATVTVKRFERAGKPSVHLYGFSYPTRHVKESMLSFYNKTPGADFHIGLLHGYLKGGNGEHEAYAPFEIQELLDKDMDYWALGHIHERQQLTTHAPIYYSGTPQGLSIKETGEKGINLVTLSEKGYDIEFVPTADFLFDEMTVNLTGLEQISELMDVIEEKKATWRADGRPGIIRLKLEGMSALHPQLQEPKMKEAFLDALQDGEERYSSFCWIIDLRLNSMSFYPREQWAEETHFLGDLIRLVDGVQTTAPFLEDLYKHSKAKRDLEPLSSDQEQALLEEAEKMLVRGLGQENGGED